MVMGIIKVINKMNTSAKSCKHPVSRVATFSYPRPTNMDVGQYVVDAMRDKISSEGLNTLMSKTATIITLDSIEVIVEFTAPFVLDGLESLQYEGNYPDVRVFGNHLSIEALIENITKRIAPSPKLRVVQKGRRRHQ